MKVNIINLLGVMRLADTGRLVRSTMPKIDLRSAKPYRTWLRIKPAKVISAARVKGNSLYFHSALP